MTCPEPARNPQTRPFQTHGPVASPHHLGTQHQATATTRRPAAGAPGQVQPQQGPAGHQSRREQGPERPLRHMFQRPHAVERTETHTADRAQPNQTGPPPCFAGQPHHWQRTGETQEPRHTADQRSGGPHPGPEGHPEAHRCRSAAYVHVHCRCSHIPHRRGSLNGAAPQRTAAATATALDHVSPTWLLSESRPLVGRVETAAAHTIPSLTVDSGDTPNQVKWLQTLRKAGP